MTKKINAQQIKSLIKNGKIGYHAIGDGLYIRLSKERSVFWVLRYSINKKRREISIGKYPDISLHEARIEASKLKFNVRNEQIDPQAEKARTDSQEILTVNDLAQDWLKTISKKLKNPQIPKRVYEKDIAPKIAQLSLKRVVHFP